MGILDLTHERSEDIAEFLGSQPTLSEDLTALEQAIEIWPTEEPVPVGESATLYRFLSFVSWKSNLNKEFIMTGTLPGRHITQDPAIVGLSQTALLQIDGQTSQWASAAVLTGDAERIENPPYKLGLSYQAVSHWQEQRAQDRVWVPRRDATIARQADTYNELLEGKEASFSPNQAEDYCFAVALGYITPEEGARRWPSLRGHESDRLEEIAVMMKRAEAGQIIDSRDHRIVQAIAMWGHLMKQEVTFMYPEAVNKSWPEFWDFIENA
jgi:5-enolpyruvylshikimate-3-phosphate synthase